MKHVFISYVHEDNESIESLKSFLDNLKIEVWIDKKNLLPGQRWKSTIRKAIKKGAFFIACFSDSYMKKDSTYMNEELTIAIDELRLKPYNTSWFIPVRLEDCKIPDIPLGAGQYLSDLQRIDVFLDPVYGYEKLGEVLIPALIPLELAKTLFEEGIKLHIKTKIKHFRKLTNTLFGLEEKWKALLDKRHMSFIVESFGVLYRRAISIKDHQLDLFIEPSASGGLYTLISAVPYRDMNSFLSNLKTVYLCDNYIDFILTKRKEFYSLRNWEKFDFIHIIQFEEEDSMTFDMLFIEDAITKIMLHNVSRVMMYPTEVISALEAGQLKYLIHEQDIQQLRKDNYSGQIKMLQ